MTRRLEALRAMANQDVSPNERDIARAKLEALAAGLPPTPPRPPAPASAPAPEPPSGWVRGWVYVSFSGSNNTGAAGFWSVTTGTTGR